VRVGVGVRVGVVLWHVRWLTVRMVNFTSIYIDLIATVYSDFSGTRELKCVLSKHFNEKKWTDT